ncbi:MAG: hydrogenase iron-sulfur subunit [Chloroflexi bacterium]|nr:hydrogenase iron-sulfur subunit [Chloroflexota bacterium]
MSWEPKILGLLCNWCSYLGADLAGSSRMHHAPNVHIVRLMCSGRVEPTFIVSALKNGADGVLIAGCHPGDCHYTDGNLKTQRRIPLLKKMLAQMGVEEERVKLAWISAAEAPDFVRLVNGFTEEIRQLGPFRLERETADASQAVGAQTAT